MNLMDLAVTQETRPLQLRHPTTGAKLTHNKKPVIIHVYGMDHPRVEEEKRRNVNASMKSKSAQTVETVILASNVVMAAAMERFENLYLDGDEELVCTKETALALLENPALPWIRDQVDAFVSNRANFIGSLAIS